MQTFILITIQICKIKFKHFHFNNKITQKFFV